VLFCLWTKLKSRESTRPKEMNSSVLMDGISLRKRTQVTLLGTVRCKREELKSFFGPELLLMGELERLDVMK